MGKKRTLALFCHKMAQALHAGFDIERALMVVQDEEKGALSAAVERTCTGVRRGKALSLSMREDELTYTSELVDLIYVTEQTGKIEEAFDRMANKFDREDIIDRKIKQAALYPAIVLIVFIICLFAVASVWKFLPQAVLFVCGLAALIALLIGAKYSADTVSKSSKIVGNVFIRMPIIGKMVMQSELAGFAENMAVFYSCGIDVAKGLEFSSKALRYEVLRDKVLKAASWVRRGNLLSDALQIQGIFPADLINSLRTGEASGNVDGMLDKIAEYYRLEVQNRTDRMMTLLRQ